MIEVLNISVLVLRKSTKSLFQAFALILFFASIFLLLGKQLYKGVLTQKCVLVPPFNISQAEYVAFTSNTSNWMEDKIGYYLCGNGTGARRCPSEYICLQGEDMNSFYASNFNFYGSSVVTIAQLMTLHFWQEIYQRMLLTVGSLHVTYFVLAFYMFLYLNALILAIITRSYKVVIMELNASDKTATLVVKDNVNRHSLTKGIVKSPSCKSYELFVCHIKPINKNETGISEVVEHAIVNDSIHSIHDSSQTLPEIPENGCQQYKHSDACQLSSNSSLTFFASFSNCIKIYRTKIHSLLMSSYLESLFLLCIVVNSLIITVHYWTMDSDLNSFTEVAYYVFTLLSVIEVLLKLIVFGPCEFFHSNWNIFDFIVTVCSCIEIFLSPHHHVLLLLRLFKLTKILQKTCSTTCNYLISVTGSIVVILTHPLVVLAVFITICIVSGMQLYGIEYFHNRERFPDQESPRWFFQDCYSSFLLVFCMLCGDWKQPMVNAIFFTSYASNLLMLIFVLIGNLVVMNLFPGLVFYTVYYKIFSSDDGDDEHKGSINAVFSKLKGKEQLQTSKLTTENLKVAVENNSVKNSIPTSVSQEVINKNMGKDVSLKGARKSCGVQKISKEFEIVEDIPSEYMADCCPNLCSFCCSVCKPSENPVLWQMCTDLRCKLYCLVETKIFRIIIGIIIITSVVILIVESTYSEDYPVVINIVRIMEPTIMMLFIMEMFLKWTAYGLQRYFKSPLGRLEFVIILMYLADLLTIQFFEGQKNIFKSLRSFRLLSVIQFFSSYQEVPPLPLKRNNSNLRSENASRESLLHLKKAECDHFILRHFSQKSNAICSRHAFIQDTLRADWKQTTMRTSHVSEKVTKKCHFKKKQPSTEKGVSTPIVEVLDCLPEFCYNLCPCCTSTDSLTMMRWKSFRRSATILVSSRYFSGFVIAVIIFSSLFLIIEVIDVIQQPIITQIAFYADKIFAALFIFIVLLRWIAMGWKSYFSHLWFWIEFLLTVSLLMYVTLKALGIADIPVLKILRVVFLLYISKVLGFNKQSKMMLSAFKQAIPSYIVALCLCLLFWLVYAIFGVFLFEGRFQYCAFNTFTDNEQGTERTNLKIQQYDSKDTCFLLNGTYKTATMNFDNVGNAYIALLQVATLQNWLSLVTEIMDNTSPAESLKYQFYTSLYFPSFIMFSTYLSLNFFAGVTLFFINKLKKKFQHKYADETQKLYFSAVKIMKQIKLHKSIPEPKFQFQKFVFRMVTSDNFEFAGFVFIGLHMLLIALDMYEPHPTEMFALAMIELNVFFLIIFTVESLLKLIAMRHYFFIKLWNLFDVFVLALCVLGALFEKKILVSPMLPAMLRVLRFSKAPRYLRRHARGVLPLINTLYRSIPTTASICILQFLIMCIYAIIGVHLFQNVKHKWDISEELNFEGFTQSMLLLFQLSTLAGWENVLESLVEGLACASKDCNNWILSVIYVVSYLIIMYYIIVKSHLVVVIENYERSMEELENILLFEDYKMFTEIWQKFDPNANGIIEFNKLPDLLDLMEEPFHFDKPNRFLIVSLNVPIYEGELVYYGDVMDSLTRDFMARNGHVMELQQKHTKLLDKNGKVLKKISSSLWRQRQNHCAHVIQNAWRRYIGKLGERHCCVFYSEVRLACHNDKVDTILASNYQGSSHASV